MYNVHVAALWLIIDLSILCPMWFSALICYHPSHIHHKLLFTTYKHISKVLSEALSAVALPGTAPVNPICLHIALASVVPSSVLVSNPLHVPWLAKYRLTMPNDTLSLMLGSLVALSVGQSASLPLYGFSGLLKSIKRKLVEIHPLRTLIAYSGNSQLWDVN